MAKVHLILMYCSDPVSLNICGASCSRVASGAPDDQQRWQGSSVIVAICMTTAAVCLLMLLVCDSAKPIYTHYNRNAAALDITLLGTHTALQYTNYNG